MDGGGEIQTEHQKTKSGALFQFPILLVGLPINANAKEGLGQRDFTASNMAG